MHAAARRGFTLIELLVVIAILGMLVALQTINLTIWQALGSRNGHEAIGEF